MRSEAQTGSTPEDCQCSQRVTGSARDIYSVTCREQVENQCSTDPLRSAVTGITGITGLVMVCDHLQEGGL